MSCKICCDDDFLVRDGDPLETQYPNGDGYEMNLITVMGMSMGIWMCTGSWERYEVSKLDGEFPIDTSSG